MVTAFDTVASPRLVLSRVNLSDLADYCCLFQNHDVMAHLGGPDKDAEQTTSRLNRHIGYWAESGVGPWAVRLTKSNQFVGMGGLQRVECLGQEEMSVGYALLPKFWGQGYAAEIASVALDTGFSNFTVSSIVSITLPINVGSQRVMEKAGFTFEREFLHFGFQQLLYRVQNPNQNCVR